ncbi:MAG: hypothetical protein ACO280_02230 [Pseudohongiellaceae bacterium]
MKRLAAARGELGVAALLALAVLLQFGHTLDAYWRGDDTAILAHALSETLPAIFFEPAAWQRLSTANLTPWLSLSFALDAALGGIETPWLFRLHQLGALAGLLTTLWLCWRRRCGDRLALLLTLLFAAGLPTAHLAAELMTRHYLEGLWLSLLAWLCYRRARERASLPWLLAAAAAYALACSAKEIYVPLLLWLTWVEALDLQQRGWQAWRPALQRLLPFLLVAAAYVLWRRAMLPSLAGGYADSSRWLEPVYLRQVLAALVRLPVLLFGAATPLFLLAALLPLLLYLRAQPAYVLTLGVGAALVLLPLVPLVAYPGLQAPDRYLWLPWFALVAALVKPLAALRQPAGGTALATRRNLLWPAAAGLLLLLTLAQRSASRSDDAGQQAADLQLRFAWQQGSGVALEPDAALAATFWQLQGLATLKQRAHGGDLPVLVFDDEDLPTGLPLYRYEVSCHCMADISASVPARREAARAIRDDDSPLSVALQNRDGLLSWQFGPATSGQWQVLLQGLGRLPLPPGEAGLRTTLRAPLQLRVRHLAEDGRVSSTPLLTLPPDGSVLQWSR